MAQIVRFRKAEEDLVAISKYIALDNPTAAARWLDQIEEKFELLAKYPYMGEAVDDIHAGLRRFTHGKYLILYEPHEAGIGLVRILHGARRIEDLF
jgi:toxin ParE1/3/4